MAAGYDMNIRCFMVEPQHGGGGILNPATGQVYAEWGYVPPGAMWFAPWLTNLRDSIHFEALPADVRAKGHLLVKTPGGDWDVDSKSANGTGWTRTGEPPLVTARPSIGVPWPEMKYHGFLSDGFLVPC